MDLAYMAALPQEEFTERRQKVLQMQPNSALLLFSEIEKRRNNTAIFLSVKTVTFGI